jgi:hypothetical protein
MHNVTLDQMFSGTAFSLDLVVTTRAARDVLALLEAAANGNGNGKNGQEKAPSDSQAREAAQTGLARLLGNAVYDAYLRNGGRGDEDRPEQVVELRLAADSDNEANAGLAARLQGRCLLLVGSEREERRSGDPQFLLFNVRLIPEVWARADALSLPARVRFGGGGQAGLPVRVLRAVSQLPEARARRESMQGRLADWRRYLAVLERTAKARQFSVAYRAFKRAERGPLITFLLEAGRGQEIPWERLRSAMDEPLELREKRGLARSGPPAPSAAQAGSPNGPSRDDDDSDDWLLGYLVDCAPDRNELTLALDEDAERLLEHRGRELPRSAVLVYKASGDLAQIRRLKFGLDSLEQGQSHNPRLGDFLFDAGQAGRPGAARSPVAREHLLQPALNDGQLAAVEGALNAPDLFLIQGPPGTGKTTVIAEICYQNALRGQRTLIASQSNLAVDHALSRLVHHASIRALRRGRADRVEVEGAPFLEDRVVGTWLARTAESCQADLAARRQRINQFEDLLQNLPRLEALAAALERYPEERPRLVAEVAAAQARIGPLRQHQEQAQRAVARRAAAQAGLEAMRARLEAAPPEAPAQPGQEGGEPAASEAESVLELMRWGDHAALHKLRASLDELNVALAAWQAEPVVLEDETGPPGVADTLRLAHLARQRAAELAARLALTRSAIDELHEAASAWQRDRERVEALSAEQEAMQRELAGLDARTALLTAQRAALAEKSEALVAFEIDQAPVAGLLRDWLDSLSRADPNAPASPPGPYDNPLGREIWQMAADSVQLHKLAALAHEQRRSRAAAEKLGRLADQLAQQAEAVAQDLPPDATPDPRQARRASHWRASPLRGLVALDARGGLHPASGAPTAWFEVESQLAGLRSEPAWLDRLPGRRQKRLGQLALWAHWLRSAADDLARRRDELEGLASHHAARLQDRSAATTEAFGAALAGAAEALGPQLAERLAGLDAALAEAAQVRPALAGRLAELKDLLAALAHAQRERQVQIESGLHAMGGTRATRHFQYLLKHADSLPVDMWAADWQAACGGFDNAVRLLLEVRPDVDPLATIAELSADLDQEAAKAEQAAEKLRHSRHAAERDLADARQRLEALDAGYAAELDWWRSAHAALPAQLLPQGADPAGLESPGYVRAVLAEAAGWQAALQRERDYLARVETLVGDWASRLRSADERDRADLKQIYIDNANVIGITCVQAGAYRFSREYRNFDCVIIDEVSKATPPELLLPMLKGARVVLVGDHRQLPPMIGPETLDDLAAELGVGPGELQHIERSLFKELFTGAPPELRVMLTEQYRMHPQIMQAINQFYDESLVCGIADPDRARDHGFDRPWLRPSNHLVWINTPAEGPFAEQKIGTTFLNQGEVDVIERLLKELDSAWAPRAAEGQLPKEVGVITFYGAQVRALKDRLLNRPSGQGFKHLRLRVGTVDRFQGMERAIIIASLVRNNPHGSVGFARKPERVNVAFSRAQELLVIVGSRELFTERARDGQATAIYGRVAEVVQRAGGLRRTAEVAREYRR